MAITALEYHQKLNIRSIQQLLRLIQSLGSHSITAAELKLILRLMREAEDGKEVRTQLTPPTNEGLNERIHVLSFSFLILRTSCTVCLRWLRKTPLVKSVTTILIFNTKVVSLYSLEFDRGLFFLPHGKWIF